MDICICDREENFTTAEPFTELLDIYDDFLKLNIYDIFEYKHWNVMCDITKDSIIYKIQITKDDILYKLKIYTDQTDDEILIVDLYYYNQFMNFGFVKTISDKIFNKKALELAKKLLMEELK
jgi:hypothetical protein